MAKIYVANCTLQNLGVNYRLDYSVAGQTKRFKPPKNQVIPSGRQVPLGGELEMAQIEDIIEQLSKTYNMIGTVDLKGHLPDKRFMLMFSLDRPIPPALIREVYDHNCGVHRVVGQERRQLAAIAGSNALMGQLSEDMKKPPEFVVDFEQEEQTEHGEARIEEGVRVVAVPVAPGPRSGKGAKAGKAQPRRAA